MKINGIDHVAIRVRNIEKSTKWYEEVLGLRRILKEQIGDVPVLLSCGQSMLNLFPSLDNTLQFDDHNLNAVMHLSFNIDYENFKKAESKMLEKEIEYDIVDREVCLSLYLHDPDGNKLELTYWKINPFNHLLE